jgi:hypothetical protein
MAIKRKEQKLVITLDNVSQSDAIALIKMFKYAQYLGNIGSSRMCGFFADGDGSFHPKFSYEYPEKLLEVPEVDGEVKYDKEKKQYSHNYSISGGDFIIDSDSIAWKIYHDPEPENYVRPSHPNEGAIKRFLDDKIPPNN